VTCELCGFDFIRLVIRSIAVHFNDVGRDVLTGLQPTRAAAGQTSNPEEWERYSCL